MAGKRLAASCPGLEGWSLWSEEEYGHGRPGGPGVAASRTQPAEFHTPQADRV